jgi:hypothetical protein
LTTRRSPLGKRSLKNLSLPRSRKHFRCCYKVHESKVTVDLSMGRGATWDSSEKLIFQNNRKSWTVPILRTLWLPVSLEGSCPNEVTDQKKSQWQSHRESSPFHSWLDRKKIFKMRARFF